MTIEAGVLLDNDGTPIYWHTPEDRNTVALPDSRTLWDIIWENRKRDLGFAHSHPGSGVPGPSWEDVTTFAAIEAALGTRLAWYICSADHIVVLRFVGPHKHHYSGPLLLTDPPWLAQLRSKSNYPDYPHVHVRSSEGPRIPAVYGSWATEVCACGMWRCMTMPNPMYRNWQPSDTLEEAAQKDEEI